MNRTLVEIIAQLALWLEFADESVVDLDAAVKQQEDLAHRLQQLTNGEREEFIRVLKDIAVGSVIGSEDSGGRGAV